MPLVFARLRPRARTVVKAMSEAERAIAAIYGDAVDALGSEMNGAAMRAALASGNPSAAVAAVSWDGFGAAMGQMGPVFNDAAIRAAGLPDNLRIVGAFDRTDPRAFAFAERQAASLVRDVTEETRDMIRATVTDSFVNGVTAQDTARRLRSFVGLTERQTASVALAQGTELSRLLESGVGRADAERMSWEHAARVQDRMVKTRAMTIARTEIKRAEMSGRYLSWAQAVEAGTVSPESRKQWLADGANPCDICEPYDNEVVMWDEEFSNGVEMPPAHPNCICSAVLMPPETELTNPPEDAPEASINEMEPDLTPMDPTADWEPKPYEITGRSPHTRFDVDDRYPSNPDPTWTDEKQAEFDQVLADNLPRDFQDIALEEDIKIKVSGQNLGKIIDDGRFKSTHEVRSSIKHVKWTEYTEARTLFEDATSPSAPGVGMGLPRGLPPSERPIYGYLHASERGFIGTNYGDIEVVLKPTVKGRTTMTAGDSLNGRLAPVWMNDAASGSVPIERLTGGTNYGYARRITDAIEGSDAVALRDGPGYWEAQIHGGVTLDDISHLQMTQEAFDALPKVTQKKLAASGIEVRITP